MKRILLTTLLFLLGISTLAQKPATGPAFDVADFNKKFEVAQWLVEYDGVAWKTSDVLLQQDSKEMEKLGQEWFCFQDKHGVWNAVYGRLSAGGYEMVFRFVMDSSGKISRSLEKLDKDFLDKHARALSTGRKKLAASIPENSPRFNQYIRQNSDKTFSVWLLPAFQTDATAVYGGEGIYTIDASGEKITSDESYFQPNFRGFKTQPPREIWIAYRELKKPTLGAIFFVWYYKSYFTKIFIDNEGSTSTALKTDKGYIWVHVEKEDQDRSKPK